MSAPAIKPVIKYATVALAGLLLGAEGISIGIKPPVNPSITNATAPAEKSAVKLEQFAEGLDSPWGLAFLPDGELLVTELSGAFRIVSAKGEVSPPIKQGVPDVAAGGQGGLLDVQVSPDFAKSNLIYFSYSEPRGGETNGTSVARAKLVRDAGGARLENLEVIFRQQPAKESVLHFGGRIVFMPDGSLFVTLGERVFWRDEAQNPTNDLGKLVRIMPDGKPYAGNPRQTDPTKFKDWAPEVWSIGHRNIQGASINPATGALWSIEHGAQGGDEVNVPEAGKNYGWPIITYGIDYNGERIGIGGARKGLEQPVYYWNPSIAPSSGVFYTGDKYPNWRGNLFVSALAGQALHRLVLDGKRVVAEEVLFHDQDARMRNVRQGPDGYLWIVIDNGNLAGTIQRVVPAN